MEDKNKTADKQLHEVSNTQPGNNTQIGAVSPIPPINQTEFNPMGFLSGNQPISDQIALNQMALNLMNQMALNLWQITSRSQVAPIPSVNMPSSQVITTPPTKNKKKKKKNTDSPTIISPTPSKKQKTVQLSPITSPKSSPRDSASSPTPSLIVSPKSSPKVSPREGSSKKTKR